jgi:hypothetical protein
MQPFTENLKAQKSYGRNEVKTQRHERDKWKRKIKEEIKGRKQEEGLSYEIKYYL